jgi:hypothetical protein
MRYVIAALIASSAGVARADRVIVEHYSTADVHEPEPWPPGAGLMLAAESFGTSLMIGGGFAYSLGDRSGLSAAAVWTSLPLLAIGPSISHFYTGDYAVGAAGVAANGLALTLCGLAIHHWDVLAARHPFEGYNDVHGSVEMFGGLALLAGASIFEYVDTIRVTRRYRERLRLTPTGTGLALSGRF